MSLNHQHLIIITLLVIPNNGLMMPLTKPDGSLDVESLLSHIDLLEQNLESKASTEGLTTLRSQIHTALEGFKSIQNELMTTQENLNSAVKELTEVRGQLATTQAEVIMMRNFSCNVSSVDGLKAEVVALKETVSHLHTKSNNSGGTTFTRWGRTVCPGKNQVVYKGYTAGTHYSDKASTASILCLPEHPIYGNHTPTAHDGSRMVSHIYGTEYETIYPGSPLHALANQDVPCVVCESQKAKVIMVPGRVQCEQDWSLEYWGYLMGARPDHASAEYICVDNGAEAIPGGSANHDGQLIYPVEAKCGVIPCNVYNPNWELSCAVCSK